MLKIGKIKLDKPVILAPMAGITSYPFRALNRRFGCLFCFLEMINARPLVYSSRKTHQMMVKGPGDSPLGVQLLGSKSEFILKALEKLEGYEFDVLDFNAACPQKKITSRGEGARLLKDPKYLRDLLKSIVKHSKVPVTVKIRLGWDKATDSCDIARHVEDAGIKILFVHGRTQLQGYRGTVNYEAIRKIKKSVDIPVVGSGDILSAGLAKRMFDETGCDGILVARGALGNPWIFKEIYALLERGEILKRPSVEKIIDTMKTHLDLCIDFYGEKRGVMNFRKFYIWYTRGMKEVKVLREEIAHPENRDGVLELIEALGYNLTV